MRRPWQILATACLSWGLTSCRTVAESDEPDDRDAEGRLAIQLQGEADLLVAWNAVTPSWALAEGVGPSRESEAIHWRDWDEFLAEVSRLEMPRELAVVVFGKGGHVGAKEYARARTGLERLGFRRVVLQQSYSFSLRIIEFSCAGCAQRRA